MQIKQRQKSYKKILLATGIAAVLIGGTTAGLYVTKSGPFTESNPVNYKKPSEDEKKTGQDIKKSTVDPSTDGSSKTNTGSQPGSTPIPAPTEDPNGGKSTVGMDITAANQNGSSFSVRALIQTISSDGQCTLTMKRTDGKTFTRSVPVQALPTSTTCQGFDIQTSQLGAGSWSLTVAYENDNVKGTASKEVTVQ